MVDGIFTPASSPEPFCLAAHPIVTKRMYLRNPVDAKGAFNYIWIAFRCGVLSLRFFNLFKRKEADCPEVRAASSDFIDGDMRRRERTRIVAHLEKCAPCRAFVNTLRATVDLLRSTPAPGPSEGFEQRIRDSLRGAGY